ncbi:MAG: right-handed parallel beta-helix repeat-containing protein [Planctomycetes bacterium]|nr:right-handed parallel beta-helix repeat-containing protein [Planctomycetota bacterium]
MNPTPIRRLFLLAILVAAAADAQAAVARTLTVGPGKTYAKPSQAAAAALDGDTILIDAGIYSGDACAWYASNLTIRGVGGRAHLASAGVVAQGKAIWVIVGANTTVEDIEFSGTTLAVDKNGAGIRQEGPGLTVRDCYFHDNDNGILTGANATSDILIEYTEFANNGFGDGYSHNLYIGNVRSLTFQHCYSHHAKVGHDLKSRALVNRIISNRIMDEATGTASYTIDLPNGGESYIIGNLIQQGPQSQNSGIVSYGLEGGSNPVQQLYFINNTVVNDRSGGTFLNLAATTTIAQIRNNIFFGPGTVLNGPGTLSTNLVATDPLLANRAGYDYRLLAGSPAIDAGSAPGSANGTALDPAWHYVHPLMRQARTTAGAAIDIGAYEAAAGGTTTGSTTTGTTSGSTSSGTTGSTTTGTTSGTTSTSGGTGSSTGSTTGSSTSSSTSSSASTGSGSTGATATGGGSSDTGGSGGSGCGLGGGLAIALGLAVGFWRERRGRA